MQFAAVASFWSITAACAAGWFDGVICTKACHLGRSRAATEEGGGVQTFGYFMNSYIYIITREVPSCVLACYDLSLNPFCNNYLLFFYSQLNFSPSQSTFIDTLKVWYFYRYTE